MKFTWNRSREQFTWNSRKLYVQFMWNSRETVHVNSLREIHVNFMYSSREKVYVNSLRDNHIKFMWSSRKTVYLNGFTWTSHKLIWISRELFTWNPNVLQTIRSTIIFFQYHHFWIKCTRSFISHKRLLSSFVWAKNMALLCDIKSDEMRVE